jgi:hypothetical protein
MTEAPNFDTRCRPNRRAFCTRAGLRRARLTRKPPAAKGRGGYVNFDLGFAMRFALASCASRSDVEPKTPSRQGPPRLSVLRAVLYRWRVAERSSSFSACLFW